MGYSLRRCEETVTTSNWAFQCDFYYIIIIIIIVVIFIIIIIIIIVVILEYHLVGLVVRRTPRERKIPSSNPACAMIFLG